jgi:hypothetical protein
LTTEFVAMKVDAPEAIETPSARSYPWKNMASRRRSQEPPEGRDRARIFGALHKLSKERAMNRGAAPVPPDQAKALQYRAGAPPFRLERPSPFVISTSSSVIVAARGN